MGRLEARVQDGVLRVDKLWREKGVKLDDAALDEALDAARQAPAAPRRCGGRGRGSGEPAQAPPAGFRAVAMT